MPFLTGNIEFKVYTDTSETEFPQELLPSISKEFDNDDITEIQATTISLAALGSQTISLNGVGTVRRFYLYSNATELSVNINSLGNLTYQALEPGYVPINVSTMVITNNSSTTATTVTLVLIAS